MADPIVFSDTSPAHASFVRKPLSGEARKDEALRTAARELEANFLAEMLKASGASKANRSFGGGEGEDQFSSFLRLEQARAMARAGGIGLAESLFEALKERSHAP